LQHNHRDGSPDDHDSATRGPVRRRRDRGPGQLSDNHDHGPAYDHHTAAADDHTAMRRKLSDNNDDDDDDDTAMRRRLSDNDDGGNGTTTDDYGFADNDGTPGVSR
jgi:hypothetical protein